ncbi:hypothetical protein [Microbacterium sp. zg-YB36]|uniref:hypothetical protein n=1 Tax=Microbacterium sp. zg-YB36 TaxID=2969407 RepID=UPI00214C9FD8|nr:hypothetical protein [Microbacterium sp. zg-YB36]MDL5352228.1 hypothetical protein [Microbacterium sp. zg-YB36]
METVLLIVGSWWWIAPAAAGVGAVGYGALTTNRRRARRLELDAARQEEQTAYRALQAARAQLRAAQADLLSAKAQRGAAGIPSQFEARRALQAAKQRERQASLQLRASRSRVKATRARYGMAGGDAPLPIEELLAQHDAVTARWLEYETDAGKALAFPQMLDARHPATLAFLRAQREAQSLRPASARDKVTPAAFLAYRDAVRRAEVAFAVAEQEAHRAARSALPRVPGVPRPSAAPGVDGDGGAGGGSSRPIWPVPARTPKPPASA